MLEFTTIGIGEGFLKSVAIYIRNALYNSKVNVPLVSLVACAEKSNCAGVTECVYSNE